MSNIKCFYEGFQQAQQQLSMLGMCQMSFSVVFQSALQHCLFAIGYVYTILDSFR